MLRTVTGSNGAPIVDSSTRGVIAAALVAVITVVGRKTGLLDATDVADLTPAFVFGGIFLGGLHDKFLRPRINGNVPPAQPPAPPPGP